MLTLLLGLLGGGGTVLCLSLDHLALETQPPATHDQQVAGAECSAPACADVSIGNASLNSPRAKAPPPATAHTMAVAMRGTAWPVLCPHPVATQRRDPRLQALRAVVLLI
ncbi:hypothetical protein [Magnetospirillum sp. 64-120]|uniref:hypothetical protein n=1 Tax=Magnetospirillum sp. 64-120 TaxID=1895778 RepID=UPI0025BC94D3|nr:hypothetical protein [Magnetospirillum sp. 64-120]